MEKPFDEKLEDLINQHLEDGGTIEEVASAIDLKKMALDEELA